MFDPDLVDRAKRADILDVAGRYTPLKRVTTIEYAGPCPVCGGRDRFGVNARKQVWNCRGCDQGGDIVDLMRHIDGSSFRAAVERLTGEQSPPRRPEEAPRRPTPPRPQNDGGRNRALLLWREGVDPRRTLVEAHLKARQVEFGDDVAGEVLRWHPSIGAMVAVFRNIQTNEPQAISRTFLDREGRKLGRKFLGPVGGAAVKLDPDEEVLGGLHIGEGIETCLAARQLGLRPTWALGSKGAIGSFPLLAGIESLTILAEPDAEKEIEAVAMRWHAAGREVLINRPLVGKDLNDALKGSAA
jgi:CHC2 zinc finger/Toprim domain